MKTNPDDILRELCRLFVLITTDNQYTRVRDAIVEAGYDENAVGDVISDVGGQQLETPLPNPFEPGRRGRTNVIRLDTQR
jgi:hypothetical protein